MTALLTEITDFLLELDSLKQVKRRTYIRGGDRLENSAEHSWHLAIACWSISISLDLGLSEEKLMKLALLHDLGEVDAGDTFLYDNNRSEAHSEERKCVERFESHRGNGIGDMSKLWEEQELGLSKEARFVKVIDRVLPFLLNLANEGRTWKEHGIRRTQVMDAHRFVGDEIPELYAWIAAQIERAIDEGWLIDS